jgi:lysozyme
MNTFVSGIDVSGWNKIHWPNLYYAKPIIDFAFIKATEGASAMNPLYTEQRDGAIAFGMPTAAYHFWRYNTAGGKQARKFMQVAKNDNLPPGLDAEDNSVLIKAPVSRQTAINVYGNLMEYINTIEDEWGRSPIIYTASWWWYRFEYWWTALDLIENFAPYDLWVADYGRNPYSNQRPRLSKPWTDYMFWQYTDKQRYPGAVGCIDTNVFRFDRRYFCDKFNIPYTNQRIVDGFVFKCKVEVVWRWIRQTPGGRIIGKKMYGSELHFTDYAIAANGDMWAHIPEGYVWVNTGVRWL